jgi:hypothetical protein
MPIEEPARPYRVIVPTRQSVRWIGLIAAAYRRLGVQPLFICDTRSSDGTAALLEAHGAEVIAVTPAYDRVEAMLSITSEAVSSAWVVRFDDDELPSAALIRWLDQTLTNVGEPIVALSRRDVMFVDDRLCYSRLEDYYFHPDDPTYLDPQFRAFRPREVHFTDAIHTPGFAISRFATAPQDAFFAHFDWILRSFIERQDKLTRYEAQAPGAGCAFARFYLPEWHTSADMRWTPFRSDEFNDLAHHLARIGGEAVPQPCAAEQ